QLFSKEVLDPDIQYTKGERAVVTLSINVHAKGDVGIPAADIVDAYLDQLLVWYLRDLPLIEGIEVAGRSEINDLTYLADSKTPRRQLDVFIRYELSYKETITTIETVEYTVET
uniref:phage neck terminator protein n=1 Tax=Candidatus Hecatella orcuttiae TaxID=1935119 RepID=UPI002867E498